MVSEPFLEPVPYMVPQLRSENGSGTIYFIFSPDCVYQKYKNNINMPHIPMNAAATCTSATVMKMSRRKHVMMSGSVLF